MLSVKSWNPGLEKPPDSLTFMIRMKTNCLKWKVVQMVFKKTLLDYEYMHYYWAGNTGREGTSVCSFFWEPWRWTRQLIEICLYFPKKQIYLSVSLSVKEMLPWGIFDAIYSYLLVSVWHFVKHKSKWENEVHGGCYGWEGSLSLSCHWQLKEFMDSSVTR